MICEFCHEIGITTSRVYVREVTFANPELATAVFYDPSGKYHIHDVNHASQRFACNGPRPHVWHVDMWRPCPEPTCTFSGEHASTWTPPWHEPPFSVPL